MVNILPTIQPWQHGEQDLYDHYVHQLANGRIVQSTSFVFEFRPNARPDVIEWLTESSHVCDLHINSDDVEDSYRGRLVFADKDGAMEFKLRWG